GRSPRAYEPALIDVAVTSPFASVGPVTVTDAPTFSPLTFVTEPTETFVADVVFTVSTSPLASVTYTVVPSTSVTFPVFVCVAAPVLALADAPPVGVPPFAPPPRPKPPPAPRAPANAAAAPARPLAAVAVDPRCFSTCTPPTKPPATRTRAPSTYVARLR